MRCNRCRIDDAIIETEEGLFLCEGCDAIRLSCMNEPTEERTMTNFIKECGRLFQSEPLSSNDDLFVYCENCLNKSKEDKINKKLEGHKRIRIWQALKWYKNMSKMKYIDRELRLTLKGLEALRSAVSFYRIKGWGQKPDSHGNIWNEEYTEFLRQLDAEMLMLLCENKYGEYK